MMELVVCFVFVFVVWWNGYEVDDFDVFEWSEFVCCIFDLFG